MEGVMRLLTFRKPSFWQTDLRVSWWEPVTRGIRKHLPRPCTVPIWYLKEHKFLSVQCQGKGNLEGNEMESWNGGKLAVQNTPLEQFILKLCLKLIICKISIIIVLTSYKVEIYKVINFKHFATVTGTQQALHVFAMICFCSSGHLLQTQFPGS